MNLNDTSITALVFYILILKNTNKLTSILMICFIEYIQYHTCCIDNR